MGLTKSIFKHSAIYSAATVLGRLISFIMLPFYANIFQTEGYGIIGMVDASLGMLGILFASGFHVAILKFYHEEDEQHKRLVISTAIRLIWGLALAAVVLPMFFSPQLSRIILGSEKYNILFIISLVTFVIDVSGQSASTFLIINQKSILYSVVAILRLVIGLALNIWLVIILKIGIIGVFITSLVTAIVASSIFHVAAYRAHGFDFDRSIAKKLLRYQLPLMPGELIAFLSRQAERFIVRFMIDIPSVGVLEMAYKFPPLLNLFVAIPFTQAWRTKSFEVASQPDGPRIIGRMFTNYILLISFVGLLLSTCIGDIIKIMTPPQFWGAIGISRVEIATTILAAANSYLVFGLYYMKKTHVISTIRIAVAIIKIIISFGFIYLFRLQGAAYSALVSEIALLVITSKKSLEAFPLELELRKIVVIVCYAASIFCVLHFMHLSDYFASLASGKGFHDFVSSLLDIRLFERSDFHKLAGILDAKLGNIVSLFLNFLSCMFFLLLTPYIRLQRNTDGL